MFNNYTFETRGTQFTRVKSTTTEHRAPTDDSVRLLNEMQEKARDNIIKTITVSDNAVNGIIIVFKNLMENSYEVIADFTINGKEYMVKKQTTRAQVELNEEILRYMVEEVGHTIAMELAKDIKFSNCDVREFV